MIDRRKKQQDKRIWERMGREPTALHDLIGWIGTDPEHLSVMACMEWGKRGYAQARIDNLRSIAENRMAKYVPDWTADTFHPLDRQDLEETVNEFCDRMKNGPQ